FLMGTTSEEIERILRGYRITDRARIEREWPRHEVEITRPFFLGVYQVTQEEYERLVGKNPSWFCREGRGASDVTGLDTRRFPVENVSWTEAVDFCHRLSELPEEKAAGRSYHLPTEAEWEYACQGGLLFKDRPAPFYFAEPTFALDASLANFNGAKLGRPA